MNMVRRMRQQSPAVVNAVKGQIVCAKDVAAGGVDQVVAVTAYRQFLPIENILFAQSQYYISTNGDREVQRTASESGLGGDGEFDVKIFRDVETARKCEVDRPTAIEDGRALAALKRHSAIVL
jgi:hypothetical protein